MAAGETASVRGSVIPVLPLCCKPPSRSEGRRTLSTNGTGAYANRRNLGAGGRLGWIASFRHFPVGVAHTAGSASRRVVPCCHDAPIRRFVPNSAHRPDSHKLCETL